MTANPWEKQLADVRFIVRLIYGSALILAALLLLRIPRVDVRWGPLQENFLYSMLLMAVSTFPLSTWIRNRFWSREPVDGEPAADARLPGGAFIMAALGEACAVYGYALYCISGNTRWPWLFLLLSAGHYIQTMNRIHLAAQTLPR